jgi:hypothetical protein
MCWKQEWAAHKVPYLWAIPGTKIHQEATA